MHRRTGPPGTLVEDELENDVLDRRSTQLVRLELGEKFEQHYTFSVVAKVDGLKHSDVYNLVQGNQYQITLRMGYWRWTYEDEWTSE